MAISVFGVLKKSAQHYTVIDSEENSFNFLQVSHIFSLMR